MSYIGSSKIGKMYLGNTEMSKAYLGNNLVFQQGSQPQPVMIPYIRGGADGSYINTGINPDSTTKVIIWARNWNPAGGIICGTRNGANVQNFFLAANRGTPDLMTIGYGSGAQAMTGSQYRYFSDYHKYELDGNTLSIDDIVIGSATAATISCGYPLHLLGLNSGGTHANTNFLIDICACKIYKGGVLVRDYTAVNTPSVGLYDAVSGTMFTNAGSGSFTYGTFNVNAYTALEYVECNGAQYFDSGIRGSNSLDYVVRFMNGDSADWPDLFLAQTSTSSNRYGIEFNASNSTIYFAFGSTNKSFSYSCGGKELVATKVGVDHYLYDNNVEKTKQSHASATFSTDYNIFVGCRNAAGTASHFYKGRIYRLGFKNIKNFVPAKVSGVAGMYDTYNDVFYPSATSTPFIAGPEL